MGVVSPLRSRLHAKTRYIMTLNLSPFEENPCEALQGQAVHIFRCWQQQLIALRVLGICLTAVPKRRLAKRPTCHYKSLSSTTTFLYRDSHPITVSLMRGIRNA